MYGVIDIFTDYFLLAIVRHDETIKLVLLFIDI